MSENDCGHCSFANLRGGANSQCKSGCLRKPVIKPPLGLTPKYIWELERIHLITEAVNRYLSINKEIPNEWIEEYNELVKNKE